MGLQLRGFHLILGFYLFLLDQFYSSFSFELFAVKGRLRGWVFRFFFLPEGVGEEAVVGCSDGNEEEDDNEEDYSAIGILFLDGQIADEQGCEISELGAAVPPRESNSLLDVFGENLHQRRGTNMQAGQPTQLKTPTRKYRMV